MKRKIGSECGTRAQHKRSGGIERIGVRVKSQRIDNVAERIGCGERSSLHLRQNVYGARRDIIIVVDFGPGRHADQTSPIDESTLLNCLRSGAVPGLGMRDDEICAGSEMRKAIVTQIVGIGAASHLGLSIAAGKTAKK